LQFLGLTFFTPEMFLEKVYDNSSEPDDPVSNCHVTFGAGGGGFSIWLFRDAQNSALYIFQFYTTVQILVEVLALNFETKVVIML